MSDKTGIEWTDATWNPITGCDEVSPGCNHCYAKTFAERWRGTEGHYFENGFDVQLRPDKLTLPLRWRKPKKIFVNSMSDLFHDDVPDSFIAEVFSVMARTPQHTYQILTKRHARMRSLLNKPSFRDNLAAWGQTWPLPNVWLGVSVENQQWANIRIPVLLDTPAAVRFLSCEPLLGPVDLSAWLDTPPWCGCGVSPDGAPGAGGCSATCMEPVPSGIEWVIVGGESGPGARPMHPQWARTIRDQCQAAGVPYLFKQWGEYRPLAGNECAVDGDVWPAGTHDGMSRRVGKKSAGRELDGRTWDQYPALTPAP